MFLRRFHKKKSTIQTEYVDLIKHIILSPMWDGTEAQIRESLPGDLRDETVQWVISGKK